MSVSLVQRFHHYSAWRANVAQRVAAYRRWLNDNQLADAQTEMRLDRLMTRLGEDKLTIAFVAEFSRGKSELINAIFFGEYGRRLLPSSAGRTTMCPTELQWDPAMTPGIQLLPIETRATHSTTSDYKRYPEEWQFLPFDLDNAESLAAAFGRVRDTKRVPLEEARSYGLFQHTDADLGAQLHDDGLVDIPRWRYAVINFPHPLLEQGLVILDTPGLNAIGTEPELTLNLLPNAHAIIYLLAVDTGVTKTDAEIWREHLAVAPNRHACRTVVLNKIDTLWDGLRSDAEIAAEVGAQVSYVSQMLQLPAERILPVSAQKGLVSKIVRDEALLARSRLRELEHALAAEVIPGKQHIVREATRAEIDDLLHGSRSIVETRLTGVREQLAELLALRGKNLAVVEEMMRKVRHEKDDFERGMARYQALRGVFSQQTDLLFTYLGMDVLNEEGKRTLATIREKWFTSGLRAAMSSYFEGVRGKIGRAGEIIAEIQSMMEAMYRKFSEEHGLRLATPMPFSMLRYQKEFERLERNFHTHFDTPLTMLTNEKLTLTQKFFETVASQVRRVYEYANRDVDAWLRAVMAPMETQVREHQLQLRRRLESIKRIHRATDELEDRIAELQQLESTLAQQLEGLRYISEDIDRTLSADDLPLPVAA